MKNKVYKKKVFYKTDTLINAKECVNKQTSDLFNTKRSQKSHQKHKAIRTNNLTGIKKHFVPSIKEWSDSIYAYNKETVKKLPALDREISHVLKSYFNFYNVKKDENPRSKRARARIRRHSFRRVITSKPSFKHTNNNVIIMLSVYNRRIKYLTNNMNNLTLINHKSIRAYRNILKMLKVKMLFFKNYVNMYKDIGDIKNILDQPAKCKEILKNKENLKNFCNNNQFVAKVFNSNEQLKEIFNDNIKLENLFLDPIKLRKIFSAHIDFYYKNNIKKNILKTIKNLLSEEMQSITLKQLNYIEKSKVSLPYLLPLIGILNWTLKKKVEFNITNIKYIYNNASVLTESVLNKLKGRKIKPYTLLGQLLATFPSPLKAFHLHYTKIYSDLYRYNVQNVTLQNLSFNNQLLTINNNHSSKYIYNDSNFNIDPIDWLLRYSRNTIDKSIHNINKTFIGLKYKFVTGARIEVAGRLTKRNVAERSIFKHRHLGSMKDSDSSYRGLSTTLLRGHQKASVQHNLMHSKVRTGSYGVKSWINTN